jgi:prepilin-type N-terminal cleavage/methylation domain-containing protein
VLNYAFISRKTRRMFVKIRIKGFTLIELIVTVTISLLLAGFGLVKYGDFNKKQEIEQGALDFVSALRNVQNKASTGKSSCPSGFDLIKYQVQTSAGSGQYQFRYECSDKVVPWHSSWFMGFLNSKRVSFSSANDVYFDAIYGTLGAGSSSSVIIRHNVTGETRTINIGGAGSIECDDCD